MKNSINAGGVVTSLKVKLLREMRKSCWAAEAAGIY